VIILDKILEYMLDEDEGFGDVTSNSVIDGNVEVSAYIISKDEGILAGIDVAKELFESKDVQVIFHLKDSNEIRRGDLLMSLRGNARDILLVERTALNLLMRMSGVASAANEYVRMADGRVIIAGTRKTQPAIGKFDKMALKIGGADTHRFNLDDMVLIKDNHIAVVGSPIEALKKAQENVSFSKKIEIEVETLEDAIACVSQGADIVMLDNMNPSQVNVVVNELKKLKIRNNSLIEISGGINKDNIRDYVNLDIDIISIGGLTHSSRSLDFSLKIEM
jgi:nicotinate-nucleotide pyrophosphorylase (carboxylating)